MLSHQTLTLAVSAVTVFSLIGCADKKPVVEPVRPVLLHTVSNQTVADREAFSGEIRARVETDLGFRVGGKITERLVDAGATVKKGQALARLDPQDVRLAADAARAQVTAAESELALAKSELDRSSDLLSKKFISQSAFDNRQNTFNAASARLQQAKATSAVQSNQTGYTTLVADADGIVSNVFAESGQVVNVGQPVVRLARAGAKEVLINAAESQLNRFKVGQPVLVLLWTDMSQRFPGTVREIAGGADAATRTYAVRVTIDQPTDVVRLGMTANVLLTQTSATAAVMLPLGAVDKRGEQAVVWAFDAQKKIVNPKAVQVAEWREDGVLVTSGVKAGDVVVANGTHKLTAGQTVRVYGQSSGQSSSNGAASKAALSHAPYANANPNRS